jgi:hypothetical protein
VYDVDWLRCWPGPMPPVTSHWLVTNEHPFLPWSPPPGHYAAILGGAWRLRAVFDPFTSEPPPAGYYFRGDAFYLPFTGLTTVERGGPIVEIWERAD